MNGLLNRDITIRTVSVLFAIILWFIVLDNTNPPEPVGITVPLKILNEDKLKDNGLAIKNKAYQASVIVTAKARKEKISKINPSDFQAAIDFSGVDSAGIKQLSVKGPFYIGKEQGITVDDVKPQVINIEFEKIIENSFKVSIETVGHEKNGYPLIKKTATPELISLTGFESLIKSVAQVKTTVDITNLDNDVVIKKEFKVYNKNGEEIPELSKNLSGDIKLEFAKEVPIIPVVKGVPVKNYVEGLKTIKPEKALITGSLDAISKVFDLKTEVIDIENKSSNFDINKRITLPEGVKLYNTPQDVVVSVKIEQLAKKDISIANKDISITNGKIDNTLKYEIQTNSLTISLRGNQPELDKLDISKLKPSVDVAGLDEGVFKVPLKFLLPDTVKLSEEYSIDLKISKTELDNRGKSIIKE